MHTLHAIWGKRRRVRNEMKVNSIRLDLEQASSDACKWWWTTSVTVWREVWVSDLRFCILCNPYFKQRIDTLTLILTSLRLQRPLKLLQTAKEPHDNSQFNYLLTNDVYKPYFFWESWRNPLFSVSEFRLNCLYGKKAFFGKNVTPWKKNNMSHFTPSSS